MTTDELKRYGLEEMREDEIDQFLEVQSIGVLGLPGETQPYLLPLSYGYDGDDSLYFVYVLGGESRKEQLTETAESAQFLVYSADTLFNWESVLLDGTFEKLPPSEWGEIAELLEDTWRPEIFRTANTSRNVKIYRFEVTDASGIKHTGLSPQFQ